MAIKLTLNKTERILFCGSKWWGDPDMPENMQYPTVEATEDGETFNYPLTFICQINCEDIAAFDPEGKLPHEGMLYFFAAIIPHGIFEFPALIISIALGLHLCRVINDYVRHNTKGAVKDCLHGILRVADSLHNIHNCVKHFHITATVENEFNICIS